MNQEHQPSETDERTALLTEIGQELSRARREKHLSVQDVAHQLKLRRAYIEALETGEWEALPGDAYAIGFLKQYATLLGLDLSEKVRKLNNAEYQLTKPMTFPDPPVAPSKKWAIWAGGIFVLLFILFNANQMSHDTIPKPTQQQVSTIDLGESLPEPPEPIDLEEQSASEADATQVSAREAPTGTHPEENAAVEARQAVTAMPVEKPSAAPARHRYTFSATGQDVWLEVYLPDQQGRRGEKSIYRLLKNGESATVETESDYVIISSGRPASLSVSVDGQLVAEAGKLAPGKRTVRDLIIRSPATSKPSDSSDLPSGH